MGFRAACLSLLIALLAMPVMAAPRWFSDTAPYPRLKPAPTAKVFKPLIVIDPGHGGRDPGAIGRNGLMEKTVTTSSATALKALLESTGRYRVKLTRTTDRYVDLEDRVLFARQEHADLFISIHAEATKSRTARGASVYTLADRARGRSKKIVTSQNWIMDVDLTEQSDTVGDILVDLAQRSTETQSAAFADILLSNLEGQTRLIGNSNRQAGFYVLLAPDVPAVLLEMGFLSNAADEKLLKTKAHRVKLMKAVRRSVDDYFSGPGRPG